jgi:hypothetical protein
VGIRPSEPRQLRDAVFSIDSPIMSDAR